MRGYDPYTTGRWYKFFIESDGNEYTITTSDLDADISGTRLKMPAGFHLLDTIYDIDSIVNTNAASVQHSTYIYADGKQAVNLPGKDLFDYATIFIFGYFG